MKKLSNWTTCTLGEVANTFSGGTPSRSKSEYFGGTIPWIKSGELNAGWVCQTSEHITENALKSSASKMVQPGTTLLALYGATAGVVGRTKIAAAINQAILAIEPNRHRINEDYLQYLLTDLSVRLLRVVQGAQPNLNAGMVRDSEVDLPPLPEQRKIADILSTWDEALEKLDALIAAKDCRKQALMQQLLTGRKRFPAFGKKAWQKVRMNQVLERVFRPIAWSAEMSLSLISIRRRCGGLFRRPDLLGSEYKTQDLHELKAGDFLVSKRQVVHGAWAIVTPEFEGGHVSKEYAIFDNIAPDRLHMPFLAWLAQTQRMIRLARVASTGVHIEKLIFDPDVFLRESIRIPVDLAEQRQIAAILDTADHELTLLRTQRNALDQQKRGLMQRLLTGKIRVKSLIK
jgi:type I restriction enzyme S subunit